MDHSIYDGNSNMIKTLLRACIIILILCIALAAFLLTPSGLRFGVKIASDFLPGQLTYQKISGVLIGPITVDHLQYKTKQETITADYLRITWHPLDLFKKELHIASLDVSDLHVITHDTAIKNLSTEKSIETAVNDIMQATNQSLFPIHLVVNEIHVTQLTLSDKTKKLELKKLSFRDTVTQQESHIIFSTTISAPTILAVIVCNVICNRGKIKLPFAK